MANRHVILEPEDRPNRMVVLEADEAKELLWHARLAFCPTLYGYEGSLDAEAVADIAERLSVAETRGALKGVAARGLYRVFCDAAARAAGLRYRFVEAAARAA